ncbi:hypothetical protein KCP75_00100 [Salmonella enterica subsp. enterica]|nr:hypothetical protein KCP75_00100 [Salmonella enterica subsp. enterica]
MLWLYRRPPKGGTPVVKFHLGAQRNLRGAFSAGARAGSAMVVFWRRARCVTRSARRSTTTPLPRRTAQKH